MSPFPPAGFPLPGIVSESRVATIENDVKGIKTEVANLKGADQNLATKTGTTDGRLNQVETTVKNLDTRSTSVEQKQTLTDNKVSSLETKVTNIDTEVKNAQNRVTGIQNQVNQVNTGLSNQISSTKTELTNKLNAGDTDLSNKLRTTNTDVTKLNDRVKVVEARKLDLPQADRDNLAFLALNKQGLGGVATHSASLVDISDNFADKVSRALPANLNSKVDGTALFNGVPKGTFDTRTKAWWDGSGIHVPTKEELLTGPNLKAPVLQDFPNIDKLSGIAPDLLNVPKAFDGLASMKNKLASNAAAVSIAGLRATAEDLKRLAADLKTVRIYNVPAIGNVMDPRDVVKFLSDMGKIADDLIKAAIQTADAMTAVQSTLTGASNAIPPGL